MEPLPFGYDFAFFWEAAGAVLRGNSPYTVGGFFSPHPLAVLLAPFALLPFGAAFAGWTLLKLGLLLRVLDRWSFLRSLLFFPVAFDLWQGQLDLLVVLLAARLDWLGAAISILRPQLALFIIPFLGWTWWMERRSDQYWKSALAIFILCGASTLIDPHWWRDWGNAGHVALQYNAQSASLFGLASVLPLPQIFVFSGIMLLAAVGLAVSRPLTMRRFWQLTALFNPVANVYSLNVLVQQVDWAIIVLALFAVPLSQLSGTNAVWCLLPLYLLSKDDLLPRLRSHGSLLGQR